MAAGELITTNCVRSVRPGYGLEPKILIDILGKRVLTKVKSGIPVQSEMMEK